MRLAGRAAAAAVIALVVGVAASFVAAALLRSATPEAGLLWRVASPSDVAVWVLAGAHGVPLEVEAGVEIDERVRDIGERIGGFFGQQDVIPETPAAADLRVRLASLAILGLAGAALFVGLMRSGARTPSEAAASAVLAAGLYGLGLALLATTAGVSRGVDLRVASAGASVSVAVAATFVLGASWGLVFALGGVLRAPGVAGALPPLVRTAGAGLGRAAVVGAASSAVCLIVLAITRGGAGGPGLDSGQLVAGAVLLGINVVAAGVVLAHGPSMTVSLDAGPFEGLSRIGYFPAGSSSLPVTRWLFLAVPVLAGVAAGRAMRSRTTRPVAAALAFGGAWALVLGVLAAMLRVDALSSFSIGSLEAGGGASIGPLEAAGLGLVWGTVTSYIGLVLPFGEADGRFGEADGRISSAPLPKGGPVVVSQPPIGEPHPPVERLELPKACAWCGADVPEGDRFCAACGRQVAT